MSELNEFERHIKEERLRQLPEKCLTCECVNTGFTDLGDVFFSCELESCYLEDLSISGEKGDKQK